MSETIEKVQQVELLWRHFFQQGTLPKELTNADLHVAVPHTFDRIVLQLVTHIAGARVHEIRYPRNWKQSLRERFLPKFWLRLYPVVYTHWKMDSLYPGIKIGMDEPVFAAYSNRGEGGYPHWEDEKVIYRKKRSWVPAWLWILFSVPEED